MQCGQRLEQTAKRLSCFGSAKSLSPLLHSTQWRPKVLAWPQADDP